MGHFNRAAAVHYAYKFAQTPNPYYSDLTFFNGDCTNFVSQVMHAGGWPMIQGDARSSISWWHRPGEQYFPGIGERILPTFSSTWAAAAAFGDFIESSGRATSCSRDELEEGDIVSIAPYGEPIHHNMVVTKILSASDGDVIYVSYHSKFRLNEPLDKIENELKDQWCLYWKVLPVFRDTVVVHNSNSRLTFRH